MTKIMMSHFTISIGKLAITRASNIYATSADIRKNTQAHYWYVSFIQILFIIFLFLINVSQLASKFMLDIRKNTQAHYWYISFIQILFIIFLFLINVSQLASKFMLNFDYIENIKKFLTFDSISGILIFK